MCRRSSARKGSRRPIAAHGGLSYMSFDRDGDAGTAAAIEDALAEIAEGEGQRVIDMIDKAPPGPIKTKWGLAFRDYDECVKYIRQSNSIKAPPGGVALPLPYTVYERPTYSVVPSNAIWRDPARADIAAILRQNEQGNRRRDLYFPQVLRDARRIGEYYPGLSPNSPECMDRLGLSLAHLEFQVHEHLRFGGGGARVSTRRSRSCCSISSRMRPMRWSTTTTSSTRTTRATAPKTRTATTRA